METARVCAIQGVENHRASFAGEVIQRQNCAQRNLALIDVQPRAIQQVGVNEVSMIDQPALLEINLVLKERCRTEIVTINISARRASARAGSRVRASISAPTLHFADL